jgi:hypothetical protein
MYITRGSRGVESIVNTDRRIHIQTQLKQADKQNRQAMQAGFSFRRHFFRSNSFEISEHLNGTVGYVSLATSLFLFIAHQSRDGSQESEVLSRNICFS